MSACIEESLMTQGCLQNSHAHGDGDANLFAVVHVIPKQKPPW